MTRRIDANTVTQMDVIRHKVERLAAASARPGGVETAPVEERV